MPVDQGLSVFMGLCCKLCETSKWYGRIFREANRCQAVSAKEASLLAKVRFLIFPTIMLMIDSITRALFVCYLVIYTE